MAVSIDFRRRAAWAGLGVFALAAAGCPMGGSNQGGYETRAPAATGPASPASSDWNSDPLLAGGSTSPYELENPDSDYVGDAGRPKRRFWGRGERAPRETPPDQQAYVPSGTTPYETTPSAPVPSYDGRVPTSPYPATAYNTGYNNTASAYVQPAAPTPAIQGVDMRDLGVSMGGGGAAGPIVSAPVTPAPYTPYPSGSPAPTSPYPSFSTPAPATTYASTPTTPLPPTYGGGASAPAAARPGLEQAKQLVDAKQYGAARALLERELAERPRDAETWKWYGDCLYNMMELGPAIDAYDKALTYDPTMYYARRGQGFARLHFGHEYWARQEAARRAGDLDGANRAFIDAHNQYKGALENLRECVKVDPDDDEALYARAMAAEGFSRRLYALARSWLREAEKAADPREAERARGNANQYASHCVEIIRADGLDPAQRRIRADPRDSGPRALQGGLFLRLAMLNHFLGKDSLAVQDLNSAIRVQQSILDDISPDNALARSAIAEAQRYLAGQWPDQRAG